ncbi:MAG TPA: hypothetical protein PKA33_11645 [Amaricoccus sp.]|uniref:hypothetical protein n=1 Tax=Amaricoccus sp. TaxID=1872485 RepID=UPI002C297871|nr:hypothetical protein [Amaricoccus sp.]HMQ92409.1 hypothetical protein [Amaricoccus sp.]HMR53142.1 hypothetical protein [Amaricoccus sp.]HMR59421.1 hypothetical protein [Amaricoccus sp.]HMU00004.1 hypothetical protein [Amaricoccus sp.]
MADRGAAAATPGRERHVVLWTGGWDSTFRVLDLISGSDAIVQPYYVVDSGRRSHRMELSRMAEIVAAVASRGWPGRLEPPDVVEMPDTGRHPDIRAAWTTLHDEIGLGSQYEWLACFARDRDLRGLELGVVAGGSKTETFLRPRVVRRMEVGREVTVFGREGEPGAVLFERMTFPLLATSKARMGEIAAERGFRDLLERSWFCHDPLLGRYACGLCVPCRDAVSRGLAYRLGWRGQAIALLPGRLSGLVAKGRRRLRQRR